MRIGRRNNDSADSSVSKSGRLIWFLFGMVLGLISSLSLILFFNTESSKNILTKINPVKVVGASQHAKVNDPVKPVIKENPEKKPHDFIAATPVKAKKVVPVSFVSPKPVTIKIYKPKKVVKATSAKNVKHSTEDDYDFYKALSDGESIKQRSDSNVKAKPEEPKGNSYFLRAASFRNEKDAEALKADLMLKGYNVETQKVDLNSVFWYRVVVGPFHTVKEAFGIKNSLLNTGIKAVMVKSDS